MKKRHHFIQTGFSQTNMMAARFLLLLLSAGPAIAEIIPANRTAAAHIVLSFAFTI